MSHRGEWWLIGWGNDTASLQRIVRRLTINSFNEKDVELAVGSRLTINVDDDGAMGSVVGYPRFLDSPFRPFMFSAEYLHHVPFNDAWQLTQLFRNNPAPLRACPAV